MALLISVLLAVGLFKVHSKAPAQISFSIVLRVDKQLIEDHAFVLWAHTRNESFQSLARLQDSTLQVKKIGQGYLASRGSASLPVDTEKRATQEAIRDRTPTFHYLLCASSEGQHEECELQNDLPLFYLGGNQVGICCPPDSATRGKGSSVPFSQTKSFTTSSTLCYSILRLIEDSKAAVVDGFNTVSIEVTVTPDLEPALYLCSFEEDPSFLRGKELSVSLDEEFPKCLDSTQIEAIDWGVLASLVGTISAIEEASVCLRKSSGEREATTLLYLRVLRKGTKLATPEEQSHKTKVSSKHSRSLQATHYSYFKYTDDGTVSPRRYFLYNTHKFTQSIEISASSASILTVSVYRNFVEGDSPGWSDTQGGLCSITLTSAVPADLEGQFMVELWPLSPVELTIKITCSGASAACYCPQGESLNVGNGLCGPCPGAECERLSVLACLTVQQSPGAVLTCEHCGDGRYSLAATGTCEACHSTCRRCAGSGSSDCVDCYLNASLTNPAAVSDCKCNPGFYPYSDASDCQICDVICSRCFGPSSSECDECVTNASFVGATTCECGSGFGRALSGCEPCAGLCATCEAAGENFCLSCAPNAARIDTSNPSACACQAGFYQATLSSCLACASLCAQCVGGTATQCSFCHINAHLSTSSPSDCVCDASYFPNPDSANCSPCHPTCKTCTNSGASDCSSCFAAASVAASRECTCDSGTFPSPDSTQCTLCAVACATCSSAAACDSCLFGAQLTALNDCMCSPGYTGSPELCSACHPTCLTCTAVGANFCDSCKAGAQLSSASPSSCVCMSGFYADGADCQACNSQCLSCTGALQCTLCYSHAHVSAGACICDNGYAPSPNAAACAACHPSCKLCFSVGASGCSACFLNASLSAAKACVCNVHYFPSPDSSNCQECASACDACSGASSSSCLTCYVHAALDTAAPAACSCVAGYAGSPEACQPCHPACLTCSTTDDSHCESCKTNAYLVAGAPSACKCVDGMYMNTVAYVCSLCKSSCGKCLGASQNQCTECQPHAHLKDTAVPASSCDCDDGYFPSPTSANCALCDATCFTCQSAGTTGCLSCYANAVITASGGCKCASSFYPNPDVRSCAACSPTCYDCSGGLASQCLSCRSHASLVGSSPSSCHCVPGYFPSPTAAACKECHETCATCQAAASTQCLTCKANASLASSPGPCVCNALYYPSPSSANCSVCSPTCKTCTGELDSQCMSCLPGATLRDGVGPSPCQCLSGYYAASDASNCVLCHTSCYRCSGPGPSSCTSCKTTASLSGASPSSCVCKDGYYPSPDAGSCATCHITCTKCTGASDSQCTDCPANATLTGGVCVCSGPFVPTCSQCHATCLTCVGSGLAYCTSCFPNAALRLPLSPLYSSSVCMCADGYYAAFTAANCNQCDTTCLGCSSGGPSGCTSCHPNALLSVAGACVCAAGYFPSPTAASCVPCDTTCAQCQANDPLQCSGCFPHAHLLSGVPSPCVCDTGYYPAATARNCGICDPSCVTCVGNEKADCSQCSPNSRLTADPNISACECIDGYYPDPHPGNCSLCHVYCKTCDGGTDLKCVTCFAFAKVSGGSCVCIAAYFPSPDVRSCVPCHSTCANCVAADSGSCTACFAHASLVASAPAACQCDDTYLPSPTPATCIACHVECHSCVGTLQTDCGECFAHASLASNPGKCVCDVGYFPDSTARLCSPCPEECAACVEINDCSLCYAHASLFVDANFSRLCRCDSHFFPGPSPSDCQQCDLTCVECSGSAQACTACFSDSHLVATQCVCNSGLFRPASTSSCQPCHVSCQECQSTSGPTSCTQCKANASLRTPPGPSDCLCINQFYKVAAAGTCDPCHATCFNCSGSGVASCTQCFPHASVASPGKCVCVDGYYPSATASNCVLCSPLCLTCSGGGSGDCLSCHSHAVLSSSQCKCAASYWPNPDSASCAPCHTTCANCSGSAPADCVACKANAQLLSLPGNCECLPGFYMDSGDCLGCDSTCEECVGAGSSACTACRQYAKLVSSAPASCICSDGYFPNPSPASCSGCAATCSLCTAGSSLDCTACHANAVLSSSPGQCTCVDGYFPSPSSCALCHPSCAKCSGASETNCLDCFLHAQLDTGKCVCESGYWPNGDSANCQLCVNTCLKCSSGTLSKCTACKPHASLQPAAPPSTCVCATGYTQLQSTGECQECDVSCSSCVGLQPSQCLTCFSNARLSGPSPSMCECIEGFYPAGSAATCSACDHTCIQCAGGGPLQCLTCSAFAVLDTVPGPCRCTEDAFPSPDSSSCRLCAATCLSCTSEKEASCLSCKPGAALQGPKPSACVCMPGFYGEASQCAPCASGCRTCRDAGECESCHTHASLQSSTCECIVGYFGDPSQCAPCAVGCTSCVTTGCLKCAEGYYALAGECYDTCPLGFKASDQQCVTADLSPPVPSLTVNVDNSLSVFFSKPMNCSIPAGDIEVEAADPSSRAIGVSWGEPVAESPQSFTIALLFESEYVDAGSSVALTFLAPQAVVDELGIPIEVTELTAALHPIGTSPANQTQVLLATPAAKTATAASRGGVSAGAAVSLLNGNPAGLVTLVNQLQLITYLSMTKLPLPSDFASSLAALNVGNMIPNPALQYFTQNVSAQSPPKHVSDYGIESTLFLNNALTFLGTCGAVLSSYIPIYLLSKVRVQVVARYFAAMLPSFRWGVPLRLWLTSYLDLFVFSLLQLRNTSGFAGSGFTSVSVLLAALCALAAAATPLLVVVFTYRNFNLLSSRADSGFNAHWGALFLSFKQTPYVSTVAYYSLFVIRRCLLAATLTLMEDQVEVLALVNTAMSYLVRTTQFLLYVAVIRPFQARIDQVEALIIEASTAIVYTEASACLLDLDAAGRAAVERAGVWTVFTAIGLNVGVSVVRSALVVKDMLHLYRMQVVKGKYRLEDVEVRSADRSTGNWLAL